MVAASSFVYVAVGTDPQLQKRLSWRDTVFHWRLVGCSPRMIAAHRAARFARSLIACLQISPDRSKRCPAPMLAATSQHHAQNGQWADQGQNSSTPEDEGVAMPRYAGGLALTRAWPWRMPVSAGQWATVANPPMPSSQTHPMGCRPRPGCPLR